MGLLPNNRRSTRSLGVMSKGATSIPLVQTVEPETARLRLRQWRVEDREPFVAICSDPAVMEFLAGKRDRAAILSRIDAWSAAISERGWGFWAAELKEPRQLIGFVGLSVPAEGHPFLPCVELGWRLAKDHWGNGYATEGGRACLKIAFAALDLPEVIATTALGNLRSSAVMERLGMKGPEKTFEHPGVPIDSPHRKHVLYRMARADWQEHDGV
jgi:RimJ/RimL family protein N-acetyltransferase